MGWKVPLSIHHLDPRLMGPSLHDIEWNITGHIKATEYLTETILSEGRIPALPISFRLTRFAPDDHTQLT